MLPVQHNIMQLANGCLPYETRRHLVSGKLAIDVLTSLLLHTAALTARARAFSDWVKGLQDDINEAADRERMLGREVQQVRACP